MRAHIQRVSEAAVRIDGQMRAQIGAGLLVLLGVGPEDDASDIDWLSTKIAKLRVFPDEAGKMNVSVIDIAGSVLVVSQFTLFASTKKGTRPAFIGAAEPQHAQAMYLAFIQAMKNQVQNVQSGVFAADMKVALVNDGPVTILIDSRARE